MPHESTKDFNRARIRAKLLKCHGEVDEWIAEGTDNGILDLGSVLGAIELVRVKVILDLLDESSRDRCYA